MIPLDFIVSTNYRLEYGRGRAHLSEVARKEIRDINNYLKETYSPDLLKDLIGKPLQITIFYFLKKSFNERDLDNLEKLSIDSIFKYFKMNDNKILNKTTAKRKVEKSDKEYIYIKISEIPKDKRISYKVDEIISVV